MDRINQNITRYRFWAAIMLFHFEIRMSKNNIFSSYFHTMIGKILRDKHVLSIFFNDPSVVPWQYLCLTHPIVVWLNPLHYVTEGSMGFGERGV